MAMALLALANCVLVLVNAQASNMSEGSRNSTSSRNMFIELDTQNLTDKARTAVNRSHHSLRGSQPLPKVNASMHATPETLETQGPEGSVSENNKSDEVVREVFNDYVNGMLLSSDPSESVDGAPPVIPTCGAGLDCNQLIEQIDGILTRMGEHFTKGMKAHLFCTKAIYHFKHSWLEKKINVFCIRDNQLFGPTADPQSHAQFVRHESYEVRECFGLCNKRFTLLVAPRGIKWTATNTGDGGSQNWGFFGRGRHSGAHVRFY